MKRRRFMAAALAAAVAVAGAGAWWRFHVPWSYLEASEVDHPAAPLRRIDLDFPDPPEGIEWFGKVRMNLFIDASGHVDRVEVLESTLPPRLTEHAVRTFSQTRFEPAQWRGRAVKSVKKVVVELAPPPTRLRSAP